MSEKSLSITYGCIRTFFEQIKLNISNTIITYTWICLFVCFIKYIQRLTIQIGINFEWTSFVSFQLNRIIVFSNRLPSGAFIIRIRSLGDSIGSVSERPCKWILRLRFNICLNNIWFTYNSFNEVIGRTCWTSGLLICVSIVWNSICILIVVL